MLMPAFRKFPDEAAIIGRLLTGYAVLEIDLMHCISMIREDFDATLKSMFRARGERHRIAVGDALGRHLYHDQQLGNEFSMAIGAVRYCLKIRNQYAHCNWYDDLSGQLAFVNLEEIAEQNDKITDLDSLTINHIDVPTLQNQEIYFEYADRLLAWVNLEGQKRRGKISSHALSMPKPIGQPPLQTP